MVVIPTGLLPPPAARVRAGKRGATNPEGYGAGLFPVRREGFKVGSGMGCSEANEGNSGD